MASLFTLKLRNIELLDAGAGAGSLTSAFVNRLSEGDSSLKRISVTAYEMDPNLIAPLRATMELCKERCRSKGIVFRHTVLFDDFIAASVPKVREINAGKVTPLFHAAIVNPPYRKIRSDSATRLLLRSAGIEASNMYTAFLSLIIRLLRLRGELVAITPRSFCNGPYFKPFRQELLRTMSLRRLHVFDSRSAAFKDESVLQENVIIHAVKEARPRREVVISTSSGEPAASIQERKVTYDDVVAPSDPDQFIHLVVNGDQQNARKAMTRLTSTLPKLELAVSTGRVVDFRAREFLRQAPESGTVPLIYPSHFGAGCVRWPKTNGRKPNAIINHERTRELLIPSGVYVLVKRFSAKEERRRIVACLYDPAQIDAQLVGFENHLNYFHQRGNGLGMEFAKGLTAFLNSTMVDTYFRQFNGHTQVNATDLRSLPYPTCEQLESIGRMVRDTPGDQEALDALVERGLRATR